ncbi:MAG: lysostaphin resistance A-like protein [Roseburia sp.]
MEEPFRFLKVHQAVRRFKLHFVPSIIYDRRFRMDYLQKLVDKLWFLILPIVGGALLFAAAILTGLFHAIVFALIPKTEYTANLADLFGFILITLLVILWNRKVEKNSWEDMGFTKKSMWINFLKGWVFGAAILSLCVVLMLCFGAVRIVGIQFSAKLVLQFIPLLIAWSIQGNAEEVLARGWMFRSIARKNNLLIGILVSSLFFTLMHMSNDELSVLSLLDLFLFGVFSVLYMLKTKDIWAISGFHAAWNCFQGNVFAFPVSGMSAGDAFIHVVPQGPIWLSGGGFGVEGSIISIVVQLILILVLIFRLSVESQLQQAS